jgi:DNA-binding NtrC family response regulator
MKTVLVVDDKDLMRDSVVTTLERAGFTVIAAPDAAVALTMITQRRPDVVVTDLKMPGMTGVELLEQVRRIDDELPVILMTAFGTIETAVTAMKLGAFDYLTKPFEGDELIICVKRGIEHARLIRENAILRAGGSGSPGTTEPAGAPNQQQPRRGADRLLGNSAAMRELKQQLPAIAASHGTVLITGQSGVGKEVVARAIHESSPRRDGPFLAVNCAALSETLLESELFGHEKGAFTGADRLRKGRFELADGGTLLLDEVSEVSPKIQAKLLRVLQERAFERVGSSISIGVDVRVIATSNRDLPGEVTKGDFRQDLYFRLNVLPVGVPALASRLEDVDELATSFVGEICRREGREPMRIAPDALVMLRGYRWPGNVRELQNICERAVVLSEGASRDIITADLLRPWLAQAPSAFAQPVQVPVQVSEHAILEPKSKRGFDGKTLEQIERETIVHTLEAFNGHRQRTAAALGIGVRTLGLKLKKWKELQLVDQGL